MTQSAISSAIDLKRFIFKNEKFNNTSSGLTTTGIYATKIASKTTDIKYEDIYNHPVLYRLSAPNVTTYIAGTTTTSNFICLEGWIIPDHSLSTSAKFMTSTNYLTNFGHNGCGGKGVNYTSGSYNTLTFNYMIGFDFNTDTVDCYLSFLGSSIPKPDGTQNGTLNMVLNDFYLTAMYI